MPFVDVHTHLTHEKFAHDLPEVIHRAEAAGLGAIVVNGLEPVSNSQILDLARRYPVIKPALGIYPLEGIAALLPEDFPHARKPFDVDAEISRIAACARNKEIIAVGECGLDGYWVGEDTFAEQERVFIALVEVAIENDLPLIIHSRKCERRVLEILAHYQVKKADLHCFCGKTKLAERYAEAHGWCFSIPANIHGHQGFQSLSRALPIECLLTETDAPYLAPLRGERNEPSNVIGTIAFLAQLRGLTEEEMQAQVWKNYSHLFGEI